MDDSSAADELVAQRRAAQLLRNAQRVFALTGAGISTESGIPDFRGPDGLWRRSPAAQRIFDIDAYRSDPEVRRIAWQMRRSSPILQARPNAAHRALARLAESGRTVTIATQNIDGLQQMAGSTEVLELHGTFWRCVCLDCGDRRPIEDVFRRLDDGEVDPPCAVCGGMLRTDTVAFGQHLDSAVLDAAREAAEGSDVALAIGTSLSVHPAAGLCGTAVAAGAALVVVNGEPTSYDSSATVVIRSRIGEAVPSIVARA